MELRERNGTEEIQADLLLVGSIGSNGSGQGWSTQVEELAEHLADFDGSLSALAASDLATAVASYNMSEALLAFPSVFKQEAPSPENQHNNSKTWTCGLKGDIESRSMPDRKGLTDRSCKPESIEATVAFDEYCSDACCSLNHVTQRAINGPAPNNASVGTIEADNNNNGQTTAASLHQLLYSGNEEYPATSTSGNHVPVRSCGGYQHRDEGQRGNAYVFEPRSVVRSQTEETRGPVGLPRKDFEGTWSCAFLAKRRNPSGRLLRLGSGILKNASPSFNARRFGRRSKFRPSSRRGLTTCPRRSQDASRPNGATTPLKGHTTFLFQSTIRICFHERRLQYTEREQMLAWQRARPGERLLEVDVPLSYGMVDVCQPSPSSNSVEFMWDPTKEVGVYIKVNCISTEFTPKKHGGEKGVPFRIQVETRLPGGPRLHAASCQVKVFKLKGADRKHKQDRDKIQRRPPHEQDKYQPGYDCTILSDVSPSSLLSPKSESTYAGRLSHANVSRIYRFH
ncbi:hypothetical protein HZH68_001910 [Vespula germanica]|uniref:Grh/CP2 DB domain-containing protein n=1 Tax=Vespula germanica TaxID=30212 RepID=A0A834KUY5_VESGE|nr:hypothetical protein HZH68_001910 [Vespula germanica]